MTERMDRVASTAARTGIDAAAAEARLFDALCELEGTVLIERLRAIERDDAALAARLRRLLAIDAEYAEHTARMVAGEDMPDPTQRIGEGEEIGAFRLSRKIGRGGMGVVYLAERRNDFAQHVAIKIMPRFAVDARSRERFAQERRLLAQLRHPHICSIVDGGELGDGTPWLAMEYVPGESLCAWCARHAVPLRERIALFLQLCDAVQYAHNRLVIHRDLKDSNVLIETHGDGAATVKLLDFGIAKSLERGQEGEGAAEGTDDNRTAAQDRFFSPMTAAPEQIRGERATVAVDVYALGALLHQLLCGFLPFAHPRCSPAALQRAILEVVPPKMSDALMRAGNEAQVAVRDLRGELDAIVAHCLRKAPEERYSDVGALARDLRAWLAGHPVSISGDDRMYRLRKFVRRNRAPVLIATAAALSLLVAFGLTLWQATQLRVQRDAAQAARSRSEVDRDRALAVADFMRDTFEDADPGRASKGGLLARELIERGARRLDGLDEQQDIQADLALLLAESYASMGLVRESETMYSKHAAVIEALSVEDSNVRWRARALRFANRVTLEDDSPRLDAALSELQGLAHTPDTKVQVVRLHVRLLERRSEYDLAVRILENAWQQHGKALSPAAALRLQVDLGNALLNVKRDDDAYLVSKNIDRKALSHHVPALQINALKLIVLALQNRKADRAALIQAIRDWQRTAERLYGSDSIEAAASYIWAVNATEDPQEQEALVKKAYAIQQIKLAPISWARATAEFNVGAFYMEDNQYRPERAEPHVAQAVAIGRKLSSRAHGDVRGFEQYWARILNTLKRHQTCLTQLADPPGDPAGPADALELSQLRLELARAATALGRTQRARAELEAIHALWRKFDQPIPNTLAESMRRLDATLTTSARPGDAP